MSDFYLCDLCMGNLSDPAWGRQEYQSYRHDECECDWHGRTKKVAAHDDGGGRGPHVSCRLFVPRTETLTETEH